MSRPGFHVDGTAKRPDEWTLAEYIATRRELDELTVQAVYRKLRERGRIEPGATMAEVEKACREAREIVRLYLD